ncbi:hypothetical protein IVB46_10165 [Bradyrhizobium sp. 61]|uniref:hypothetical protein n=1 Tax=Bradyrhizobium sp. 61 TaxID=2782679 RepID=UPI001FF83B5F|nr:hypothetical protein [Bradyrhizobium sp. 61]MCK1275595.1 hypothetical protein [Bradyrhizobium sp. 61]
MTETVLEETQKLNGNIVQTVRRADGTEYQREYAYTCSICGAPGDTPFPTWAISCMRKGCREGEITDRD